VRSLPVLMVVPHASRGIPFDVLADMLGEAAYDPRTRAEREAHLYRESDPHTDAIFYVPGARHVYATVNRFVVDVNRYREDEGTNGVVKLSDFQGAPLYPCGYRLTPERREERLRGYYDPFHAQIERILKQAEVRLLLDGHGMSAAGPMLGPDEGRNRPALMMMTGRREEGAKTLSPRLAAKFSDLLSRHFAEIMRQEPSVPQEILIDDPWPFDEIVDMHARPEAPSPVYGFGLEISRALYLQDRGESSTPIPERVEALQRALSGFVTDALPHLT
jgi:N-formylglutamate deformylase